MPIPDIARELAADVPVYVRPEGERWALVATEGDGVISEHDSERQALDAALAGDEAPLRTKRAVLRTDGEPDGVWRWLDASAEEDEPIADVRITARALWEMAAGLNARATPIPVNGGGAPDGYVASEAHGDARDGGDHAANGWAHSAAIVVDETGRAHLYLRAELLPEIAREVDRGRLAFGSVLFAFKSADEDDNHGVVGATLISHALTNDPAVTTLSAGSERHRTDGAMVASRTRKTTMPNPINRAQRGPAYDVLVQIAGMLGVEISDEMEGDSWYSPITERINALKGQAVVEEIVEGAPAAPAEEPGEVEAQRAAAREEPSEEPADESAAQLAAFVELARAVLGKPDATPADALAEMQRIQETLAAAIGEDAPEPVEMESDDEDDEAARTAARATVRDPKATRAARDKAALTLARSNERFETREWLDREIAKRKLGIKPELRATYLDMAIAKGRDVVGVILDAHNRPPSGSPMPTEAHARANRPTTYRQAVDACMADARAQVESATRSGEKPQAQVIRARAQRLAAERFPEIAKPEPRAS